MLNNTVVCNNIGNSRTRGLKLQTQIRTTSHAYTHTHTQRTRYVVILLTQWKIQKREKEREKSMIKQHEYLVYVQCNHFCLLHRVNGATSTLLLLILLCLWWLRPAPFNNYTGHQTASIFRDVRNISVFVYWFQWQQRFKTMQNKNKMNIPCDVRSSHSMHAFFDWSLISRARHEQQSVRWAPLAVIEHVVFDIISSLFFSSLSFICCRCVWLFVSQLKHKYWIKKKKKTEKN